MVCVTLLCLAACAQNHATDFACSDARSRAFGAADQSKAAGASPAEARQQVRVFVKEVRDVPSCFAATVRREAEAADAALQRGELPRLRGSVATL